MMETKFTPGPWCKMSTGNHQGLVVEENGPESIAVVYDNKNSDIVAAAPDLLEACQLAIQVVKQYEGKDECWDVLNEAIRKATE